MGSEVTSQEVGTTERPTMEIKRCVDPHSCSEYATCYEFASEPVCICSLGLFGGADFCFQDATNLPMTDFSSKVLIDTEGEVELDGKFTHLFTNIFARTINAENEQQGVTTIDGLKNMDARKIFLLSPAWHLLNAMAALRDPACSINFDAGGMHTFNLFTLAEAFKQPAELQVVLQMDNGANLTAKFTIVGNEFMQGTEARLDYSGTIDTSGNISAYLETDLQEKLGSLSYYAKYRVDNDNVVRFAPQDIFFEPKTPTLGREIKGTWTAEMRPIKPAKGYGMQFAQAQIGSSYLYLKYYSNSYCIKECSGSDCKVRCVDRAYLMNQEPGPCDCQICPGKNEKCYPKDKAFTCDCKEAYHRDSFGICSREFHSLPLSPLEYIHQSPHFGCF
ncbi:hypothetical protein Ciccas_010394 [Cichlidogyrus casuarinus]|uniref:Uncharacterized protein n=1 Tax=Cichlidogyrus casuarinus TaxID=1844966 RepID=A0ABD2PYU8_9PLAT